MTMPNELLSYLVNVFKCRVILILSFVNSCGNTATHCGVANYGNCGYTACGSGLCCTRYGQYVVYSFLFFSHNKLLMNLVIGMNFKYTLLKKIYFIFSPKMTDRKVKQIQINYMTVNKTEWLLENQVDYERIEQLQISSVAVKKTIQKDFQTSYVAQEISEWRSNGFLCLACDVFKYCQLMGWDVVQVILRSCYSRIQQVNLLIFLSNSSLQLM